jgi:hypothetical protein
MADATAMGSVPAAELHFQKLPLRPSSGVISSAGERNEKEAAKCIQPSSQPSTGLSKAGWP